MRNLTEETMSLRHHEEKSFREWLRLSLVCIAALKKFYTKRDQQRRNSEREMSRTAFRTCEISSTAFQSCHTTTAKVFLPLLILRTYNNQSILGRVYRLGDPHFILGRVRRFNPFRVAQKVSFSPSACVLCLSESANDQQNKRKFSRTYVRVVVGNLWQGFRLLFK